MKRTKGRHYFFAAIAALIVSATAMWSWNTVAELFGAPTAEFKHIVAMGLILAIARWTLSPARNHRRQAESVNED
jgi:hypothetical protein